MGIVIKTILLKIYEPNKEKRKSLEKVIELYAKTLNFYLEVIKKAGIYRVVAVARKKKNGKTGKKNNYALNLLEELTVSTKLHPNPPYPLPFSVRVDLRRSAINQALGLVLSYVSNLKNWHLEGKELGHSKPSYPHPQNYSPHLYSTLVELKDLWIRKDKDFHFVRIKVPNEKESWEWKNYPVKVYRRLYQLLEEGYKPLKSARIIKKGKDYYIAVILQKVVRERKVQKPKFVINVDLNIQRNLACIGIFEIDWKRKESKLRGIKFVNGELLRLVRKRDFLLEEIRIKQKLMGRSPRKGDNKILWEKVRNLNRDIAFKVAREISKVAKKYSGEAVVVFEKLTGLRGDRGRKSRKLNRKLNFWLRRKVVERVKEIKVEEGFEVDFVNPKNTSQRCSKCGSKGERFSPAGSKALFLCKVCRYEVNADVNAIFNQHFLYLSHLLKGGGKARSVVRVGTSLKSPPKRGHNLSGVPKATATHFYIFPSLSMF